MIAQHGEFLDPLSVVDLSVVKNRGILPKKYKIEALKALYQRPREMYKLTFMKGDTPDERFETFLKTYGVGIYRDPLFWQDAAQ